MQYKVTAPDGKVTIVEAPEGTAEEQIIEMAKRQLEPSIGPVRPENAMDTVAGTIAGGANVARGAIPSVGQVVRQVAGTAEPINMAGAAGNMARRFIGPYGAVTSAADAERRFAEGNYGQAAISGLGAAGYGMSSLGNLFPPAKIPGMVVGGAADLANMGIDYLRQMAANASRPDPMSEEIRRMAFEKLTQQGGYVAP